MERASRPCSTWDHRDWPNKQIEQTTFFQSVLSLKHEHEPLAEFVPHAISLIVENSVNRYTLSTSLMQIALEFPQTPDAKELAIETLNKT